MITERTPLLSETATSYEPQRDAAPFQLARLGQAYAALTKGKLPTSQQLAAVLAAVENCSVLDINLHPTGGRIAGEGRFSNASRQALEDLKRILRALQSVALNKNGKNELQELIYHSSHAEIDLHAELVGAQGSQLPDLNVDEAQRDLALLLFSFRTMARLILANVLASSQSILDDTFYLFRTVFADAACEVRKRAEKAETALRPDQAPNHDEDGVVSAVDVEKEAQELKGTLSAAASAAAESTSQTKGLKASAMNIADQDFRDVALTRLNKLLARIRDDPDSAKAFEILLDLGKKYVAKAEDATDAAKASIDDTKVDIQLKDEQQHAHSATSAFRAFIETLSGRSLDPLLSLFSKTASDVKTNDELRDYFSALDQFLRKMLKEPEWAASQGSRREGEALWDQGRHLSLSNPAWRLDLNSLSKEMHVLYDGVRQDESLVELGSAIAAFTVDVETLFARGLWTAFGDTRGIVADVINILVPRLFRLLQQYPIPRTEFTSPQVDAVLDDFVLSSLSFLPTFFKIDNHSEFVIQREADLEAQRTISTADGSGHLYIRGLHFSAHDISYWFRRKVWRWLPGFRSDSGLVEFSLEKKGLEADISYTLNENITLEYERDLDRLRKKQADDTRESFFTISGVDVRLSSLDLRITRSQHPIFFWLFRPFARFSLKTALHYVLSSQLKSGLEYVDQVAFRLNQQVQRLRLRGFGPIEAWLTAFAQPAPEVLSTGFKNVAAGTQSAFKATQFTKKGIVATMEGGAALAVGTGAQVLDPEMSGPHHFGPSGDHGGGSAGRIAAEVDESITAAKKNAERDVHVAGQGLAKARKKVQILQGEAEAVRQGVEMEDEDIAGEEGWKSSLFDLV